LTDGGGCCLEIVGVLVAVNLLEDLGPIGFRKKMPRSRST
jgi:hypothetical protein